MAVAIWDKLDKFSGYAFNKAHSAGYAFISYQTAYLKYHYYPFYMASVLNNRLNKWDVMTYYILSIRSHGTEVLPPHINKSSTYFSVEQALPATSAQQLDADKGPLSIRFGLGALKNVGTTVIDNILEERQINGPFTSFQNFCKRVDSSALNKRCLESLILSGSFDDFGKRSQLMSIYPKIVKLVSQDKKVTDSGQLSLFAFAGDNISDDAEVPLPSIIEYDSDTLLRFEKEVVGIYLSGHPLQAYAKDFANFNFDTRHLKKDEQADSASSDDSEFDEIQDNKAITMGAIISNVKRLKTKVGNKDMAVLTVEDLFGSCEIMLFPAVYDKFKGLLENDVVIKISGKLSIRDGEDSIILAETLESMTSDKRQITNESVSSVHQDIESFEASNLPKKLYLKYNVSDTSLNSDVMNVLNAYKGDLDVVIRNTATGAVVSPTIKVRNCNAIVYELNSIVGSDNVKLI